MDQVQASTSYESVRRIANIDTSRDVCLSPGFVIPDLIGDPGFLDSRFRRNDTHGSIVEFAITF
jgi:hypothetical protein